MKKNLRETALGFAWGIVICAILSMCTSCKTKTVIQTVEIPVPEYHNVYINNTDTLLQKDSIYIHDSLYVATRCDTIYKEKYRTTYHDRIIYKSKTDTIQKVDTITVVKTVEVPAPVESEKPSLVSNIKSILRTLAVTILGGGLLFIIFQIVRYFTGK